jgi:uncharacterized phage protein (TIGR01671 family)
MSREIKFRAWDKLYSKMHNGEDVYLALHGDRVIQDSYFTTESQCASVGFEDFIVDRQDQFELMQFTGLLDKNGKEIYEGDVLRTSIRYEDATLPHIGEVVYCCEYGSFATRNDAGNTLFHSHCINTREVAGNIYENPDLLPR